jgi:type III secretory pathway component EscR
VPQEREFLADELGLQLHMGKLHIHEIHSGVEFLGSFVKPYRDYVSNKTLERMAKKFQEIDLRNEEKAMRTVDSYLGILSQTASRCITQDLMSKPLAA